MSDTKGSGKSAHYDVIIVGGGPAGLFAAYYLSEHSKCRVLLIEKGKTSAKRNCPISAYQECIKCKPCNILSGIGGLTALRDSGLVNPPVRRKIELWSSIVLGTLLIVLGGAGSAILLGIILGVALISTGLQQWRLAA